MEGRRRRAESTKNTPTVSEQFITSSRFTVLALRLLAHPFFSLVFLSVLLPVLYLDSSCQGVAANYTFYDRDVQVRLSLSPRSVFVSEDAYRTKLSHTDAYIHLSIPRHLVYV